MTLSELIAMYIEDNINLQRNTTYNIYIDDNDMFFHTVGSMEYRDKKHIVSIHTMDEAPQGLEEILNMVEFQINKNK